MYSPAALTEYTSSSQECLTRALLHSKAQGPCSSGGEEVRSAKGPRTNDFTEAPRKPHASDATSGSSSSTCGAFIEGLAEPTAALEPEDLSAERLATMTSPRVHFGAESRLNFRPQPLGYSTVVIQITLEPEGYARGAPVLTGREVTEGSAQSPTSSPRLLPPYHPSYVGLSEPYREYYYTSISTAESLENPLLPPAAAGTAVAIPSRAASRISSASFTPLLPRKTVVDYLHWIFFLTSVPLTLGMTVLVLTMYFIKDVEARTVSGSIAGFAAFSAFGMTVLLILCHMTSYTCPSQQRLIIRIIIMVPVFALDSFFALIFFRVATVITLLRDMYEAYAIYQFYMLLMEFLGGEERVLRLWDAHGTGEGYNPLAPEEPPTMKSGKEDVWCPADSSCTAVAVSAAKEPLVETGRCLPDLEPPKDVRGSAIPIACGDELFPRRKDCFDGSSAPQSPWLIVGSKRNRTFREMKISVRGSRLSTKTPGARVSRTNRLSRSAPTLDFLRTANTNEQGNLEEFVPGVPVDDDDDVGSREAAGAATAAVTEAVRETGTELAPTSPDQRNRVTSRGRWDKSAAWSTSSTDSTCSCDSSDGTSDRTDCGRCSSDLGHLCQVPPAPNTGFRSECREKTYVWMPGEPRGALRSDTGESTVPAKTTATSTTTNEGIRHTRRRRQRMAHIFPLNHCLSPLKLNRETLFWWKLLLTQYVILNPLLTLVTIPLFFTGVYRDGAFEVSDAYPYLALIRNASVSLGFTALVYFYFATKNFMGGYSPTLKFVSIKVVIFLSFWQSLLLGLLNYLGYIPESSSKLWTSDDVVTGLQNVLICVEMFFISIAHRWVFSDDIYLSQVVAISRGTSPRLAVSDTDTTVCADVPPPQQLASGASGEGDGQRAPHGGNATPQGHLHPTEMRYRQGLRLWVIRHAFAVSDVAAEAGNVLSEAPKQSEKVIRRRWRQLKRLGRKQRRSGAARRHDEHRASCEARVGDTAAGVAAAQAHLPESAPP